MTDAYTPTEAQIASVIDRTGGDVRKLATAYLRAQKRARDAELAFGVMGDIQDLTLAAFGGDVDAAERSVMRAKTRGDLRGEVQP